MLRLQNQGLEHHHRIEWWAAAFATIAIAVQTLPVFAGLQLLFCVAWPPPTHQRQELMLPSHVRSAFALSNGTYGSPRMTRELRDQCLPVGQWQIARLMRDNGLRAQQKRRFKRTTDSEHAWPVAPNLLDQDFSATAPNGKWPADISYILTKEGGLCLAIVMNLFSRRIIG